MLGLSVESVCAQGERTRGGDNVRGAAWASIWTCRRNRFVHVVGARLLRARVSPDIIETVEASSEFRGLKLCLWFGRAILGPLFRRCVYLVMVVNVPVLNTHLFFNIRQLPPSAYEDSLSSQASSDLGARPRSYQPPSWHSSWRSVCQLLQTVIEKASFSGGTCVRIVHTASGRSRGSYLIDSSGRAG